MTDRDWEMLMLAICSGGVILVGAFIYDAIMRIELRNAQLVAIADAQNEALGGIMQLLLRRKLCETPEINMEVPVAGSNQSIC